MAGQADVSKPAIRVRKQVPQARHSSRCSICSHPQRRSIERAFLYRRISVAEMKTRYGVGHDAVYRHAHALGLLEARNRNWRRPVEPDECPPDDRGPGENEKTVFHAEVEATHLREGDHRTAPNPQ